MKKSQWDDIFEKHYNQYIDECKGISMMGPSSSFGRGGIQGKFKEACKRMIFKIVYDGCGENPLRMRKGKS